MKLFLCFTPGTGIDDFKKELRNAIELHVKEVETITEAEWKTLERKFDDLVNFILEMRH